MRRTNSARKRGQSTVESALVFLLLIMTVLGTLDIGQVIFIRQGLVERARTGARYGAVHAADATAIRNIVLYNSPAARNGSPLFGITAAMVDVARPDIGTDEERIVVTISNYPYQFFSPFIAGSFRANPVVVSLPVESP
jgi:Flp pilus assembly protein TadG